VRRVVALGDSFAWGVGVELEDDYPQRLERGLNRLRREAWEVVNLALPGMNTRDHLALLEKEGFGYGPDVVLLGYVLNDAEDAGSAEARRAASFRAPRYPPPLLWDHSVLYRFAGTLANPSTAAASRVTFHAGRQRWADRQSQHAHTMGALP
jgi:hypothetical protein